MVIKAALQSRSPAMQFPSEAATSCPAGINSSSIPRRKLLLSNKHIYSIQSCSSRGPSAAQNQTSTLTCVCYVRHNGKQHTLFIRRHHETPYRANGRFHRDSQRSET
ncbi:hypothetical protein EYF80_001839 [Liparis tanakae]|uniref:Uncharacterized protein n=1 Tax=Liparis tanakae TaxID=230148 RepID=A0A4Z2JC31_9TELE|nr:hypothetical protein EYF80_001839 [Liparis tanakae]